MASGNSPLKASSTLQYGAVRQTSPFAQQQSRLVGRAATEPGNRLRTAKPIQPVPGVFAYANSVGFRDVDLFKIVVNQPSAIQARFRNGSRSNLVASVLNQKGKVISFGGQKLVRTLVPGISVIDLSGVLPGRYFIKLQTRAAFARYRIQVTTQTLQAPTL